MYKQQKQDKCQGNIEPNLNGNKDNNKCILRTATTGLEVQTQLRDAVSDDACADTSVINFRHVEIVNTLLNTDVNI